MEARTVSFMSRGVRVVGHLFEPPTGAPDRKQAAIVVGHPVTGVKEQAAGLYARKLAEAGFVTLAFDAAYQGESEGVPRSLEDPYQRVEDFKCAVSYMSTLPSVDSSRIGVLGICGSGGYVPFAAQTDQRMRAVATVSAACLGDITRHGVRGYPASGLVSPEQLQGLLEKSGQARTSDALGHSWDLAKNIPDSVNDLPKDFPRNGMLVQGFDYYRSPRAQHPRSTQKEVIWGVDMRANYDSYAFNHMISPRPLLMIVGGEADTAYQSENAIQRAKEPKELFVVPGKTHIDLYDDLSETAPKLTDFMTESLCS